MQCNVQSVDEKLTTFYYNKYAYNHPTFILTGGEDLDLFSIISLKYFFAKTKLQILRETWLRNRARENFV